MTITIEKKVTTVEQALIEVNIPSYWKNDLGNYYKITGEIDDIMQKHVALTVRTLFPEISKSTTGVMDWDKLEEVAREEFETVYEDVLNKLKY
jgi:hypothetical protein